MKIGCKNNLQHKIYKKKTRFYKKLSEFYFLVHTLYYAFVHILLFQHDRCQSLTELNKEPPAVPSEKVGQINFGLEYDYQQNTLILRIIAVRLRSNLTFNKILLFFNCDHHGLALPRLTCRFRRVICAHLVFFFLQYTLCRVLREVKLSIITVLLLWISSVLRSRIEISYRQPRSRGPASATVFFLNTRGPIFDLTNLTFSRMVRNIRKNVWLFF